MRSARPIVLMIVLLGFLRAASAQSDVPRPQPGRSIQLNQKQTKVQPTKDGPMSIVAEVPITVTVLQADKQRTVIRWKRGVFKLTDVDCDFVRKNPAMKPMLLQMAVAQMGPLVGAMDDLAFDVMFSPRWDYLGLANYEEVHAAAVKSIDAMDELRRKNGNPPLDAGVRKLILNRPTIEQIFPKETLTYLAGSTYAVRRGATAAFDTGMPNPLGGDPIVSRMTVTFDAANDASRCVVLRSATSLDMGKWTASIKQMIAKTPGGKPLSPEDEQAFRESQLESNAEYHIDPASGLAKMVQQKSVGKGKAAAYSEEFLWTAIGEAH